MTTKLPDFIPIRLINGRWKADLVGHQKAIKQFRKEAGVPDAWPDGPEVYDQILSAAGKHGYGLETAE